MDYYTIDENQRFLVSVKGIVRKNGKILLIKFPSDAQLDANKWDFPGGLLQFRESFENCLTREVFEETGLKASVDDLFTVGDNYYDGFILEDGKTFDVHYIEPVFNCTYLSGEVKVGNEHDEFAWIETDELRKYEPSQFVKFIFDELKKEG